MFMFLAMWFFQELEQKMIITKHFCNATCCWRLLVNRRDASNIICFCRSQSHSFAIKRISSIWMCFTRVNIHTVCDWLLVVSQHIIIFIISEVLEEAGHKVQFVKIPYRNVLEVVVNGENVFQCDQDKLDFGEHVIIQVLFSSKNTVWNCYSIKLNICNQKQNDYFNMFGCNITISINGSSL